MDFNMNNENKIKCITCVEMGEHLHMLHNVNLHLFPSYSEIFGCSMNNGWKIMVVQCMPKNYLLADLIIMHTNSRNVFRNICDNTFYFKQIKTQSCISF